MDLEVARAIAGADTLRLGRDLCLPLDVVTQKVAILARSGAGKTYTAGKLAELLLDAGAQVVAVDPVGVWWGLRLSADGKGPGVSIPVFGGQHGDIPLEAGAGRLVAELVAERRLSVVLDVSEFTGGEQRRFVADFAEALLQAKKRHKSPVLIMWEEAQEFVPQRVSGEVARMCGAMERLIKLGRNFGIGTLLISQRPQAVNKDALNQTELLIVGQMSGPQELATIKAWVRERAPEVQDQLDQLPRMPVGEVLAWSPQWLRLFTSVAVERKRTFDASRTPDLGSVEHAPALAPIDLEAVRAAMAATIEEAALHDPAALRRRIAMLEKDLATGSWKNAQVRIRDLEAENAALRRQLAPYAALEQELARLVATAGAAHAHAREIVTTLDRARMEAPTVLVNACQTDCQTPAAQAALRQVVDATAAKMQASPRVARVDDHPPADARSVLLAQAGALKDEPMPQPAPKKGPRRILWALASRRETPLTRDQVALLAGFAPDSGTFTNYLSELRKQHLVLDQQRHRLGITQVGLEQLGANCPSRPATTAELVAMWRPRFTGLAKTMLDILVQVFPEALTREDLAQRAGLSPTSGTFTNYLSELRTHGLIVDLRRRYIANPTLFPNHEAAV